MGSGASVLNVARFKNSFKFGDQKSLYRMMRHEHNNNLQRLAFFIRLPQNQQQTRDKRMNDFQF